MMLNQTSFGGTHLLYTLVDKEGMENHPVLNLLRAFMPEDYIKDMEIESNPMVEYTVVKAVTDVDHWEVILIRHDFPHEDEESQKFCDKSPYQIIMGGEIHFNPKTGYANWSLDQGHAEFQRLVDEAEEDGAHLKTLV